MSSISMEGRGSVGALVQGFTPTNMFSVRQSWVYIVSHNFSFSIEASRMVSEDIGNLGLLIHTLFVHRGNKPKTYSKVFEAITVCM